MILIDTGPIVALLNRNDPYHQIGTDATTSLPNELLVTTWPCLTESLYMLGRAGGMFAQDTLWQLIQTGQLEVRNADAIEIDRIAELMRAYSNLPMDLADASIVVAAEITGERKVFTFDKHFWVYRLFDGSSMTVVP